MSSTIPRLARRALLATSSMLFLWGAAADCLAQKPTGSALHLNREIAVSEAPWRHQVYQNDLNIDPEKDYVLTFWVRASRDTKLKISTKNSVPPWAFFGLRQELDVNREWQRAEFPFSGKDALPGHSRVTFNYGDMDPGEIWIAEVAIRLAGEPESENLILNPDLSEGMEPWISEGVKAGEFSVGVVAIE